MKELFYNNGFISGKIRSFTCGEVLNLCKAGVVLVDIREDYMNTHKAFDLPNVVSLPKSKIEQAIIPLDKKGYYILADASGLHTAPILNILSQMGYENIGGLSGGLVEWEREQMPVIVNPKEKLSGSCMCQIKYRDA
ncbi:MAG: hypothetical protein A2W91_09395 [Bacteroidetes bacterium GWF2_38_335]|nr:MAG: hypothetical protein A2W91_09395 [Bacteroidetes bacterium GWF2_38_335]OFY80817.1 MAG: hypothetical protein A2281_09105 [Bacteroidetes bacterium RIFOXYA12_FULL_38_20]HBS86218.1 hypothetical protein [Bacteroidales bacterium]